MMQMHPFWRVQLRAFLPIFVIFFLSGCQEYNPHPSLSESASFTNITQLTDQFDRAGEAFFSNDARWIIFRGVLQGQKQYQLYVAKTIWNQSDITGIEKPIRITSPLARSEGGSFSADGLTLIFSSTAGQGGLMGQGSEKFPVDMRIFRVDGWEGAVAMTDFNTGIDLAQHPVLTDHAFNGECRFSPDAQHIVFTSTRGGNPNLYVMHPDGTHVVQLTNTPAYDGEASFSPDGKQLLYCSDRDANHVSQVYLADLTFDGSGEITGISGEHPLTYDNNMNINPAWCPDGKHIIYSTSRHGRDNYKLYLMVKNGRQKTRITYEKGSDLFPVFSPDSRYVMWTSKRPKDGSTQIFLAKFQFPMGS
jgi:Tol biopolymer transport system component